MQWQKPPLRVQPVWSDLQPEFFATPSGWYWNAPDLWPYYRLVLYGGLALLLLGSLLISNLFQSASGREARSFNTLIQTLEQEPERFGQAAQVYLKRFPKGHWSVQVQDLATNLPATVFYRAMNQAEHQPALPLRLEAYQALPRPRDPQLGGRLQKNITRCIERIQIYETRLARARTYIQKEYYSNSLLLLAQLVKQGPEYGALYTEAQELLNRTSLKKIEFYIVKGQLGKARNALNNARLQGVSADVLDHLSAKIKNIEQLKPLR